MDEYLTWHADAGTYTEDDPDEWHRELGDAWRAGFTSIELDDERDYDAALGEQEIDVYRACWLADHEAHDPDTMAACELGIAYEQGVRAAYKALGAVTRPGFIEEAAAMTNLKCTAIPEPDKVYPEPREATDHRAMQLLRKLRAKVAEQVAAKQGPLW